mgnify:CR=1 FL=1
MPFASDRQRRWMFANRPAMAARWASEGEQARARATCGYTGTIAGGRIVWVLCDRAQWAADQSMRWGWWCRDNQTMQMETGDAANKASAQSALRAALARLRASATE